MQFVYFINYAIYKTGMKTINEHSKNHIHKILRRC